MSTITPELIDHLAHLSRLSLTPEQKKSLIGDMESILGLVSQLEEVDVGDVAFTGFDHIHHHMKPLEGVVPCEDGPEMLKNVTHPLENNGIVMKSSLNK